MAAGCNFGICFAEDGAFGATTVAVKIISERRESCFHCGPRASAAMESSGDCAAEFAAAEKKSQPREKIMAATMGRRFDTRIAISFWRERDRERSWEWAQTSAFVVEGMCVESREFVTNRYSFKESTI